jgi:hypothetical protein
VDVSPRADALVQTELERRFLAELRSAGGEVDGPMERHGVRCFLLIELLARERGVTVDREVCLCAALIHDAGLYDSISRNGVYTDDGGEFAAELFSEAEARPERARLVRDACAYHHALTDQSDRGIEVELMRLADRIEVSGGLVRSGLSREQVRRIFAEVPRDGFYRGVAALLGHLLRERPLTLPRIFKLN